MTARKDKECFIVGIHAISAERLLNTDAQIKNGCRQRCIL